MAPFHKQVLPLQVVVAQCLHQVPMPTGNLWPSLVPLGRVEFFQRLGLSAKVALAQLF